MGNSKGLEIIKDSHGKTKGSRENDGIQKGDKLYQPECKLVQPPSFIESENQLLGRMILDKNIWEKFKDIIHPHAFYDIRNQELFQAMQKMDKEGIPIELSTILYWFRKQGDTEKAGGWLHWSNLTQNAIAGMDLEYHLSLIKNAYTGRLITEKCYKLAQAVEKDDTQSIERLSEEIFNLTFQDSSNAIITLANREVESRRWFIEELFPDKFPSMIYGEGGIGKSFVALIIAILACIGNQSFLGYKLIQDALNVLFVDYELDEMEQTRRAQQVAKGSNLPDVPPNLHYYSPDEPLRKLLPKLRSIIKSKKIGLIIIDSWGASGTDGESVEEVVNILTKLKELGVAVIILDHQSKNQAGENYRNKTPFGSVYKQNLSRSVLQLSRVKAIDNRIILKLTHKKSNFSKLVDDIIFDIKFEEDRIVLAESTIKTQKSEQLGRIWQIINQFEKDGEKAIQKSITTDLKGEIARDKVISLLEKGEGTYWDKQPGERTEKIYKTRNLENGTYSTQDSSFLKNNLEDTSND